VPSPLLCSDRGLRAALARASRRLPELRGAPIRIHRTKGLGDRFGPVHAGAFPRERRIAFDCAPRELPRILTHEVFHFVWLRMGNQRRWAFEGLILAERDAGARGELGWSAEWRKIELAPEDLATRSRRWREYCCESFCDTAAWLYAGAPAHPEFTLSRRWRERREAWFAAVLARGPLPV
jgi:hypothetical protein